MIGVKGRRPYKSCEPQIMTGPPIVKAPSIGEEVIFNVKAMLSCEEEICLGITYELGIPLH